MRQFLDRLPTVLARQAGAEDQRRRIFRRSSSPGCSKPRCTSAWSTMRYDSVSSRRVKDYVVHPYRLPVRQGGLYLLAYVPEYTATARFAVDRIASLSLEKQRSHPSSRSETMCSPIRLA
jgi:hypothetical protein